MTPSFYKASADHLRKKPLPAILIGGLLFAVPGAAGWVLSVLRPESISDGPFFVGFIFGFSGAWMYGCMLFWAKQGDFDGESRWNATLVLDFCALVYIGLTVILVAGALRTA